MRLASLRFIMLSAALLATSLPSLVMTAQEASPDASPMAGGAFNPDVIGGDGLHWLEPAPAGEVAIIAMGPMVNGQVPVIVHNHTDEDVGWVHIDAVVFGEERALLGVSQNGVSPGRLLPGGLGMTTLGFTEDSYPEMVEIETIVKVNEPEEDGFFDSFFPTVVDWSRQESDVMVILSNDQDEVIADPEIRIACFDADGALTVIYWRSADEDVIPVGEQIRMQESLNAGACDSVVFTTDGERD